MLKPGLLLNKTKIFFIKSNIESRNFKQVWQDCNPFS